ncbi:MAG: DUF72 domain-containing protein, partial [Dehalococcoidia bacterium]|nr:DUF72 domain-containing protein [Dehalococcoidia bacterium]
RWLQHYATIFDTVEVNATFYRLQSARTVAGWKARTPEDFRFAVKASRYITHMRRLGNGADRFLASIEPLAGRMGPLLYQLPPTFGRDDARLDAFLARLPAGHIHAFEFRHPSWWAEEVAAILRRHGAIFAAWNMGGVTTPLFATGPEA